LSSFSARREAVVLLPKAVRYPPEKALTEPLGYLEEAIIAEQMDRIPYAMWHSVAVPTLPEVILHCCVQLFG